MAFFSAGENHHDIAVLEVGAEATLPARNGVGLYHVALKIGTRLEDNGLELFVDADPTLWREAPTAVATVQPLEL